MANTCKYQRFQRYVSYNNGITWQPIPDDYAIGSLIEANSPDCGGGSVIYKWVPIDEYECVEVLDKYTYYFNNGGGIVIGCSEGEVSINNEYTAEKEYMSQPSENYSNEHIAVGVSAVTVHNCVDNVPYNFASGFIALNNATIESGITTINSRAFYECVSLESVSIPDTVTKICSGAFAKCAFSSITIGSNVTELEGGAFYDCFNLREASVSSQKIGKVFSASTIDYEFVTRWKICEVSPIEGIGTGVFESCDKLSAITINNGVEYLGSRTFNNCKSLKTLNLPSSVKGIGAPLASYLINGGNGCPTLRYRTSTIGFCLGCTSLSSVTLNNGLEYIGNRAFQGCTSLTSVTIPDSVRLIFIGSFKGCTSLTNVTIGSGIKAFGNEVFSSCTSLSSVTINALVPPSKGSDLFANTPNDMVIYVPAQSVSAYKSAWSDYASRITAII